MGQRYTFKLAVVIQIEVKKCAGRKPSRENLCLQQLQGTYTVTDVLVAVTQ